MTQPQAISSFAQSSLWAWYIVIRQISLGGLILCLLIPPVWIAWKKHEDRHSMKSFLAEIGQFPLNFTFEDVIYHSLDEQQRNIKISAPEALLRPRADDSLTMKNPLVDMYDEKGNPVHLQAETGVYQKKNRHLYLRDKVSLQRQADKFKVGAERMNVDLQKSLISIPKDAQFEQNGSVLQAGKTVIDKQQQKVFFSRGVKMTIQP